MTVLHSGSFPKSCVSLGTMAVCCAGAACSLSKEERPSIRKDFDSAPRYTATPGTRHPPPSSLVRPAASHQQNQQQRPEPVPGLLKNSGRMHQGNHADQQKNCRAAQAANQKVAVHFDPPCDSPRRRMTSHTPSPIRSTGQVNSISRPEKISNCPSRNNTPQSDQHNRANRFLATPSHWRYRRNRWNSPDRQVPLPVAHTVA